MRNKIHQYEPGNATLYEVGVFDTPCNGAPAVLVLVNFGKCMPYAGLPGEPGYLAEKLGISWADAEALYAFLEEMEMGDDS